MSSFHNKTHLPQSPDSNDDTYCFMCWDQSHVTWQPEQREYISNPRSGPSDSSHGCHISAGKWRKSQFFLWGRSKDATSSDIPSILKYARRNDLGTGIPVNLVILTRRLLMCDLFYPPNRRKCHPFRQRHLVTMRLTPLWAARLLLSPPHCQIVFVPSVTLMYEKFKMSLV